LNSTEDDIAVADWDITEAADFDTAEFILEGHTDYGTVEVDGYRLYNGSYDATTLICTDA
jgi:hypothetical protein